MTDVLSLGPVLDLIERIQPEPMSGCWLWTGAYRTGYGIVKHSGKMRHAHRVVYERLRGPIPDDCDAHHVCRVKLCVNPDHLRILPHSDHGRIHASRRVCKRGHEGAWVQDVNGRNFCRVCRAAAIRRSTMTRAARKKPEQRCSDCGRVLRARPCGSPLHVPKARWRTACLTSPN